MKLKNSIILGCAGLALATAGGMRTHSRIHSKPSPEIEQQLSQNTIYQDIVAQNQNHFKREFLGVYYDYAIPLALKFGSKISDEQRSYLKTNRFDATGKHKPYTHDEQALLWHLGASAKPNMRKDFILDSLEASAFRKP